MEMAETTDAPKTIVVTGATSGIGLAVCELLLQRGVHLIGVGRSLARCSEAKAHLRRLAPDASLTFLAADLSLQSEVRLLAARIRVVVADDSAGRLDALINNAGTLTYWQSLPAEGFETQWAVNPLASFLLTAELLPLLQAAPTARIVT